MSRAKTSLSSKAAAGSADWRSKPVNHGELHDILETNSLQITPLLLRQETKTDKLQEGLSDLQRETCDIRTQLRRLETHRDHDGALLRDVLNMTINRDCTRLHDPIQPLHLPVSKQLPGKLLPPTVGGLLKLQKISKHEKLAALLEAYEIDAWHYWSRTESELYEDHFLCEDDSDADSIDSDQGSLPGGYRSVLEAVQHHPRLAVESLASRLGLDFERIYEHQRKVRAQKYHAQATKRQGESLREENLKRIPNAYPSAGPTVRIPPKPRSSHYTPDGFTAPRTEVGWEVGTPPSGRLIKVVKDCGGPADRLSSPSPIAFRPSIRGEESTVADNSSKASAEF